MKLTEPEFNRLKPEDQEEYLADYGHSFAEVKLTEEEERLLAEKIEREKKEALLAEYERQQQAEIEKARTAQAAYDAANKAQTGHGLLKATSILIPGVGLIAGAVMIGDEKRGKLGKDCLMYAIISMVVFFGIIILALAFSDASTP